MWVVMTEKILWVVQYESLDKFVSQAVAAGITALAIRTDNNLPLAIQAAHKANLKVFGWRWPSALLDSALHEAEKAVTLLGAGLDGYFVDPEGDPGKPWDWDKNGLEAVADRFCSTIKNAAGARPFGVTSHYLAAAVFPKLPWSTFINYADLLLPQAYWRTDEGRVGHADPGENYDRSLGSWGKLTSKAVPIVPMAGEIAHATAGEIQEYALKATGRNSDMHFYSYTSGVAASVWEAIKSA